MPSIIAGAERRASAAGRIVVLSMVFASANFGCAQSRRDPFAGQDGATMSIQVENNAFENATIHAIWPGRRLRLGTVIGHSRAAFGIALETSVLLRFEIDLLAGPKCFTEQIWADPGDILILEIDPRFLDSVACTR